MIYKIISRLLPAPLKVALAALLLLGWALTAQPLSAQQKSVAHQYDGSLALPENTVEGWLDNGLHYLILPNATPAHTVEMRLVMRLGAVQENDRQKGCAHFLEHMAFAGTEHFPQRSMIDYLEGLGMKFGRDINAVTGYDRTIFMLTVPMEPTDLHILDSTLLVLKDWLSGVSFKSGRIRRERGVILEELRTYRQDDVFYDLKIGQSRFKERMPLGSADDIRRVKRRQLVDFYERWYTPQLASVVVVGDIVPAEVEQRIEKMFSSLPRKKADDYHVYPLTYGKGVRMMEVRDSIRQRSVLELILPHSAVVGRDVETTILKERARFAAYALDHRLTARHLPCHISDEWYLSDLNHFVFSFSGDRKEQFLKMVSRVACEMEQLIREGWDKEEYEQLLGDFAGTLTLNDEGKASAFFCDDFTDYILQGDRYLHNEKDLEAVRQGVRATEMVFLQRHLADLREGMKERLLLAYRNNAGEDNGLTEQEIVDAWEKGTLMAPVPFKFRPRREQVVLVATPPCLAEGHVADSDAVVAERRYESLQVAEVRLRNGMRLIFRPTLQGDSVVLLNWLGKGGLAQVPPRLYHQYESTAGFMEMGGIAKVPYDTLSSYMSQTGLLLNISIGAYWHDILGTAPAERSQELFNLISEKIHRPELCYADFEDVRKDDLEDLGRETLLEQLMQRAADRMLVNRMDSLVGNSPSTWFSEKTRADVEAMNLDSIADYFSTLYRQLAGTTVVITGNYDLGRVKREAVSTFSRFAPVAPRHEPFEPEFRLPGKSRVEGFDNDNESQTVLEYVYAGHYSPSLQGGLTLKLMRDLLQDRLLRVLRERENIVYSPYASLYYDGDPQRRYYFNLSLSVDTDNSARTDRLVREIIQRLQRECVGEEELGKLKKGFVVNRQKMLTEEAGVEWRNILSTLIKNGEQLDDFDRYQQQLDAITPEMVRKAFRDFMPLDKTILLYQGKHQLYK